MSRRPLLFLLMAFFSLTSARGADDDAIDQARKALLPHFVTLKGEHIPLSKALGQLFQQTGNAVADRRQAKTDPRLKLNLEKSTFWPALEAIAQAARCGISTYQSDRQVALVDAPWRSSPTAYQGIFRTLAKVIAVTRNAETATHVCTVTLDVAWEPRFEPLYVEVGPMEAVFAPDDQEIELRAKIAGQGKISVAGRGSLEVDIHLPAPRRSSPAIKSLEGRLLLTGAAKMLTFDFPEFKAFKKSDDPITQTREGVQVSLVEVKIGADRWSVEVHIDNPKGNPSLESYQSWLGNNQIAFEKGKGPDRQTWIPGPNDWRVDKETATQADIVYSFKIPSRQSRGSPGDWTLVYRTPGRIVEIGVPFAFKDVTLP